MEPADHTPRVLRFEAAGGVLRVERGGPVGAPWSQIAHFGGSALAVALVGSELDAGRRPLVIAVGDAVRRGLPTAARAAVAGIAPLTGRYVEGHVGGDLGPRLAALADALVIARPLAPIDEPCVLVIEADGSARLELVPGIIDLSPDERIELCTARLGEGATLACGPAAHVGVPFASLASGTPASFVGRGGLGALFASHGLAALHLCSRPVLKSPASAALVELLASSPRLVQRADAGGFEQAHGLAARGELKGDGAAATQWSEEWRAARTTRVGCRGCPTPCGFVFEGVIGGVSGVRGHFGAARAMGAALGAEDQAAAIALISACDRVGLDAKEAGAVLDLIARACETGALAETSPRGSTAALTAWIQRLARRSDDVARGAARGARVLALELELDVDAPGGLAQPFTPRHDLAALALVVGAGAGTDPMRSFPFASEVGRARLAVLLPHAPPGADRPDVPEGKGWVAWWHENFVAAIDTSGFCVFSASALLTDGLVDVAGLARAVAPASVLAIDAAPERALLAAGAAVVLARAAINARLGAAFSVPVWARALVDEPGLGALYRACRGVDREGRPVEGVLARLGDAALAEPVAWPPAVDVRARVHVPLELEPKLAAQGRVAFVIGATGQLARALGARLEIEFDESPTARQLLEQLAREHPAAAAFLLGVAPPSVWCNGRRFDEHDHLPRGTRVDLVSAILGG